MSGTGPVEPADPAVTGESHDVIGADTPHLTDRLTDRWRTLPPRARTAALAAAVITAGTLTVLLTPATGSPDRATPPQPVPYPANVTAWRYLGPAATPRAHSADGLFRFAVSVDHGPPVTLTVDDAAFAQLTARTTPGRDTTVHAGTTRRITVRIAVSDCTGLPLNAHLPFLDVTLRNARAIQHHSFIFGDDYARDLSGLLHAACDPAPARLPQGPTGSAGSQNAD